MAILSIYMRLFKEAQKHTAYRPEPQILHAEHFGCRQIQWSCLWFHKRDWSKMISSSNLYNILFDPVLVFHSIIKYSAQRQSRRLNPLPDFLMNGFPEIMVISDFSKICIPKKFDINYEQKHKHIESKRKRKQLPP